MQEDFLRRKKVINDLIHDKHYTPMKAKEIAMLLNVSKEDRPALMEVLDALVKEGAIGLSKRGKYGKAETVSFTGVYNGTAKGFGFVTLEGEEQDVFISEKDSAYAMSGDTVLITITNPAQNGHRPEGRVLKILEHGVTEVVGLYEDSGNYGFVISDDASVRSDIFVTKKDSLGAQNGHKVVVRIKDYGDERRNPEGEVLRIIGHKNDPGVDILSIVEALHIPTEYPEEVMTQVATIPETLLPEDLVGRKDLREVMMVTIDGEDAKDLDDAVSLSVSDGIYHLGVHIADVSQFVPENTPLDREALNRATSVYLVDRVIPMLPHKLCNGVCSLNEGVDRLTLSCLMDIDAKGNIIRHEICESVIRSNRRMTYTAVKEILEDHNPETISQYQELVPMFTQMAELSKLLREKRHQRGAIDFDFPECHILLNEKGIPCEIGLHDRNVATKLIEDFMLAANETVAEEYFWQELPFVYRIHEKPDPDKIRSLGILINNYGLSFHMTDREVHPKELQKLLERIEGTEHEAMISRLTLRSLSRASYKEECVGHFGLAAKYYCHFTSPIRRYPDLQIHRIIKENLRYGISEKRLSHYQSILPQVCIQSSKMERRADDAEREVEKMKKAEYMSHHVGELFKGVISGVTAWGAYVELPNTVEGLVHVTEMKDDRYEYMEEKQELIGERFHKKYRLGQSVVVKCIGTDKLLGQVNFRFSDKGEIM